LFTLAHSDYYEPFEIADPGQRYLPTQAPQGWLRSDDGIWTYWTPVDAEPVDQGWKVHVSSAEPNLLDVLDVVTAACADLGVPFKHLAGRNFFLALHSKHGSRVQSGKFTALYPRSPQVAHELLLRLERDLAGINGP
jgi:hypothetical protein